MTTNPELSAAAILALKDQVLHAWEQLPPEHQATFILILLQDVQNDEWGSWVQGALRLSQTADREADDTDFWPVSWVGKADLLAARPDLAERINALTADELQQIARQVGDALQPFYLAALEAALSSYLARHDQ